MRNQLPRSPESFSALNKLVEGGFYRGDITYEGIELLRTHFPVNFKVIGKLNADGYFEIHSDFRYSVGTAGKFMLGVTACIVVILLVNRNWFGASVGIMTSVLSIFFTKQAMDKEINLFMDKYLAFMEQGES